MQGSPLDSEVSIVPFSFKYLPLLIEMHNNREYFDMASINMKMLPKIGYIALLNKQPIAAGFLRRVEGGFGQLDTFVTNPYFGSKIRNDGINKVWNALISEARVLKLKGLLAFSKDTGLLDRAVKHHKFQIVEQSILAGSLLNII